MYGTSQGYRCGSCSGCGKCGPSGGLEYIASSTDYSGSSGTVAYAISSGSSSSDGESGLGMRVAEYSGSSGSFGGYQNQMASYDLFKTEKNYHFIPDDFLVPGQEGMFVGKAEEVKDYVEEAFEKIFDCQFPADVKVSILNEKKFRKLAPAPGVMGLSINRKRRKGVSEIVVLEGSLGRVMLTLGHELGHVLTSSLENKQDEEAKAYAFSLEWMKVLRENNIGHLGQAIVMDKPAENGLHNVAFGFVRKLIDSGREAWEVYLGLIRGLFGVDKTI